MAVEISDPYDIDMLSSLGCSCEEPYPQRNPCQSENRQYDNFAGRQILIAWLGRYFHFPFV